jgi:hypothetical protein
MKNLRQAVFAVLLVALPVFANDYTVTCVSQDYVICEGPPAFIGSPGVTTIRIGANNNNSSPSGRNAVMIFPLPALSVGEQSVSATLVVNVAGRSGAPAFNTDLWGIGFQGSTTALVEYFEANTGDSGNTKLQDNWITPSFTSGNIAVSNSTVIGSYLQTFYASNPGYSGGSYVFLRMNPDADSGTNSLGWSISAAESGVPAMLTITTTGGPTNLPPTITGQPQNPGCHRKFECDFQCHCHRLGHPELPMVFQCAPLTNSARVTGATTSTLNISPTITK